MNFKKKIIKKDIDLGNIILEKNDVIYFEKKFKLNEGINDKHLFKAVFTAGGPGAGKSCISNMMFSGEGFKFVNSDILFTYLLDKVDLPKIIDKKDKEMYAKQMSIRGTAKDILSRQTPLWINGMLPLVVDGTGRDYTKISLQKNQLEEIGYDTALVFINTSLNVALERNRIRSRKVDEELVIKAWESVQSNIGKFQNIFGKNFYVIDNNKYLTRQELDKLKIELVKKAMKFMNEPLQNRTGLKAIKELKLQGKKYLNDIIDELNIKLKI